MTDHPTPHDAPTGTTGMSAQDLPMDFHVAASLFNRGDYYEAHELLETLWLRASGSERGLYQGTLQVGVAVHHLRRGNRRGALRLLDSGARLLAPLGTAFAGVETGRLREEAERLHAWLEESGAENADGVPPDLLPHVGFTP